MAWRTAMCGLCLMLFLGNSAVDASPSSGLQQAGAPLRTAWRHVADWESVPDVVVPGSFRGPQGVDVGPDGRIYVADGRAGVVQVLSPVGVAIAYWDGDGVLAEPVDIAVGDGQVFVSETAAGRVEVLGLDGVPRGGFAVVGRPVGLAWDAASAALFVTTEQGGEVVMVRADGTEVRRFGAAQLSQPRGLDVGGDGLVYVTDMVPLGTGSFLRVFDTEGVLVGMIPLSVDGQPQTALDVAVEDRDAPELWAVTELFVIRIDPALGLRALWRNPGGRGVAIGPGPGLVIAAQDYRTGFTGVRRHADRRAQDQVVDPVGGPFAPLGELDGPRRISASAEGHAFVLDNWPRVQAWSSSGVPLGQFGAGSVQDLAAGLPGSVFTIDGRSVDFRADDGLLLWTWQPPSVDPNVGVPWGWLTHIDAHGSDFAALDTGDQHIFVRDYSGNPLSEFSIAPPEGFTSVGDIALADDVVWLLDRARSELRALDRSDGATGIAFPVPRGTRRIDAGEDGTVFTLVDEGWVIEWAPDGTPEAAWPVDEPRGATDIAAGGGRVLVSHADGRISAWEPDPAGTPGELPTLEIRCLLQNNKTAEPREVAVGDSLRIGLTIDGECPLGDAEADIMLLVDTSGSMNGPKMSAARTAVLEFVGQLDYSLHQVGLITFSTDVDLVQELTANPRQLIKQIPTLGDDSGTNMTAAMTMADQELRSSRARTSARQVVVILSDGRPNGSYEVLYTMADAFRSRGREIYTIGLGLDVDRFFMLRMAGDPAQYFEAPTEYELSRIYQTIGRRAAAAALLRSATIVDQLPPDMEFEPGSDVPRATWDPAARTLTWEVEDVPSRGLRLRYRVRPQLSGLRPTNVHAGADYEDGVRFRGRLVFPVPEVMVKPPERWTAHLPIAFRQSCPPVRIEVVLVFDVSASMREALPSGEAKLEAALQAARVFLSLMDLGRDRVAIAAFAGDATLVQALTDDSAALLRALDRLPSGSGTRIERGLAVAMDALESRRAGSVPAIVLLTDGNQSDDGRDQLLRTADAAREAGLLIFTIGLGPDADRALLMTVSGAPERTFMAPGRDELNDIYREIAAAIPCS